MAEMLIQSETLTNMADKIRILSGVEGELTTAQMDSSLDEANNEVSGQSDLIAQIATALEGKAASGGDEQATPVISVNASGLITATAGTKSSTKQLTTQAAKTITPNTTSQTAISSGVYTTGAITVAAIPNTYVKPTSTKAETIYTPTTTSQTIAAGTYCSGVQTIAGDSNLVAGNIKSGISIFGVSGSYEGSGGSSDGGGENDETLSALMNGTITGYSNDTLTAIRDGLFMKCSKLTTVSFPAATEVNQFAFYQCSKLTSMSFPMCTKIGDNAFGFCSSFTEANFPSCTTIGMSAFGSCFKLLNMSLPLCSSLGNYAIARCSALKSIDLPMCKYIGTSAFRDCYNLSTASFPMATNILAGNFSKCYHLKSLYLMGSTVCALSNSNAFASTPIGGYSASAGTYGSIYVPASLLTSYQTATNWTYFSSRFVGV